MFVEMIRRFAKITAVLGTALCWGMGIPSAWSADVSSTLYLQQPKLIQCVSSVRYSMTSKTTMRSGEEEIDLGEIIATPTPTLVTLKVSSESDSGTLLNTDIPMGNVATNTPTVKVVKKVAKPTNTYTPTPEDTDTPTLEATDTPTLEDTPTALVEKKKSHKSETTPTATVEPTQETKETPSPEVTAEPTQQEQETPSQEVSVEPTQQVQETPSPVVTVEPTQQAQVTPSPEVSATPIREEAAATATETPTSTPTETVTATPTVVLETVEEKDSATPQEATSGEKHHNVLPGKRVGLSPEWFGYLVQAGYLARSASSVPKFGFIAESSRQDHILTTGMHLLIKQKSKEIAKEGDQLMVYRALDEVNDPETNRSLGVFIKNLGVLKVTRVEAGYVQADVVKVFAPFFKDDSVKSFEDELDRWKQSRRRKPLSADPIECTVTGLSRDSDHAIMNETIVLNAGEDQGIVAGMDFELKKPVEATVYKKVWTKVGKARVFYVGGKYSLAKVLWNQDLILNGYRAQYQP